LPIDPFILPAVDPDAVPCARAFEYFKNDIIHRLPVSMSAVAILVKTSAFFNITGRTKKAFRFLDAFATRPPFSTCR
jgi:hypothetical protein